MEISREESYRILEIGEGSSKEEIRTAYKRQALKWHPDKHGNSPEATKKFQAISSAYERLMKPEAIEISLTMEQMFDLFAHVFCRNRGFSNGFYNLGDSDSDNDYTFRSDVFREKPNREKDIPSSARPTVSEAKRHEEELLKEEEKLKKQKEKRKERKKRRKAKKKQEKEVRYGGGDSKKKGKKEVIPESSDEEEDEEEEEVENKENIQANTYNGDANANPIDNEPSSKAKTNNSKESSPSPTNIDSHLATNSNHHRKEVHGGHQGSGVGGGGERGIGAGGDGGKQAEGKKSQNKSKKSGGNISVQNPGMSNSESNEETEGLDMNSAFFARAASGMTKKQPPPPPAVKTKKKGKSKKEESESIEDMDPQILESRKLAVKGNEMANEGNYHAAVKYFSKAIELNPMDFRFFGNRSFCYDHLQMYDHALRDADQAILLDKTWPKGHYRKGRALSGLKLYSNAEAAFEHVLKLDKNCAEAVHELRTVRVYRLVEMGFGAQQSEAAILQFETVPAALENLLAQGDLPVNGEMEEVYVSDEEDYITQTIQESKLDSRNPENLKSLWIGNLQPSVTEKELKDLFKPFGEVSSMRRMPEKFCAFVNYKDPRMASRAMDKLQGRELHGKHLLIKFPDNPIEQNNTPANSQQEFVDNRFKNLILRKTQTQAISTKPINNNIKKPKQQAEPGIKLTGPVNGDECYFWRTTGCWYAERCRYKHLPESKGIDRK